MMETSSTSEDELLDGAVDDELTLRYFKPGGDAQEKVFSREMPRQRLRLLPVIEPLLFGQFVDRSLCSLMAKALVGCLSLSKDKRDALEETLAGRFLSSFGDKTTCYRMATLLSGNLDAVRSGLIVPPWSGERSVWTAVEMIGADRDRRTGARKLRAYAISGEAASLTLSQTASPRFVKFLMREIGYSKYKPFDSAEVFNLWFNCLTDRRHGKVRMTQFGVTTPQREHNHALYKLRHGGCPYKRPIDCCRCQAGLDRCEGALRPSTLERGVCANGHDGMMRKGSDICERCREEAV